MDSITRDGLGLLGTKELGIYVNEGTTGIENQQKNRDDEREASLQFSSRGETSHALKDSHL